MYTLLFIDPNSRITTATTTRNNVVVISSGVGLVVEFKSGPKGSRQVSVRIVKSKCAHALTNTHTH